MRVNWESDQNLSLLNPKWSTAQVSHLMQAIQKWNHEFKAHIFILTSGTTARGKSGMKWVALSKNAFLSSANSVNLHIKSDSQDVWINPLPEFHVGGLGIEARAYLSQARVMNLPIWSASNFMDLARASQATLTALVPAQLFDLIQQGHRCPEFLRALFIGGGALSKALHRKACELGWPVLPTYGMTETCSQIASLSLDSVWNQDFSSNEAPSLEVLSHLRVREGEGGKLKIKGDSLLSGYLIEEHDEWVFRDPKEEGWFTSEDVGVLKDGCLRFLGRSADFIKIGGESVEVSRLASILEEIRSEMMIASDIALLPVPDERLGHVIHLLSDRKASPQDLKECVDKFNSKVLGFEKVRGFHLVDRLPRTELGKLIQHECLKLFEREKASS